VFGYVFDFSAGISVALFLGLVLFITAFCAPQIRANSLTWQEHHDPKEIRPRH
jgi:hypothetical protein